MRETITRRSRPISALERLSAFTDRWWVRVILGPVLVTAPPGVVFAYLDFDDLRPDMEIWMPDWFGGFLIDHPFQAFVLAVLYIYLLTVGYGFLKSLDKRNELDIPGFLRLFNSLEAVVGEKADRFGNFVRRIADGGKHDAIEAFDTITQPERQIALLVKGLHAFFDAVDDKGVAFKVSAVIIRNNQPLEWLCYWPVSEPPRIPLENLRSHDSAICRAVERRELVIVEDRQTESRKDGEERVYVPGTGKTDGEGSLICYPVLHHYSDTIPYVLSVVADKKGYFAESRRELYLWMLKHFEARIGLEHSLLLIKDHTMEEADSGA